MIGLRTIKRTILETEMKGKIGLFVIAANVHVSTVRCVVIWQQLCDAVQADSP